MSYVALYNYRHERRCPSSFSCALGRAGGWTGNSGSGGGRRRGRIRTALLASPCGHGRIVGLVGLGAVRGGARRIKAAHTHGSSVIKREGERGRGEGGQGCWRRPRYDRGRGKVRRTGSYLFSLVGAAGDGASITDEDGARPTRRLPRRPSGVVCGTRARGCREHSNVASTVPP